MIRQSVATFLTLLNVIMLANANGFCQEAYAPWIPSVTIQNLEISTKGEGAQILDRHPGEAFEIRSLALRNIDDQYLTNANCWNLSSFRMNDSPSCTDDSLAHFIERNCKRPNHRHPTLEHLNVSLRGNLTGDFIKTSIDSLPMLKSCCFHGSLPDIEILELLGSKTQITELRLLPDGGSLLSEKHAKAIASMPRLRNLVLPESMDHYAGTSNEDKKNTLLHMLGLITEKCNQMDSLRIPSIAASETANIRRPLSARQISTVTFTSDNDLHAIANIPNLKEVHVDLSAVSLEALTVALKNHEKVSELHLDHFRSESISPSFWSHIKDLKHIKSLVVSFDSGPSEEHVQQLTSLLHLSHLTVYTSPMFNGRAFSKAVANLQNLRRLQLECSSATPQYLGGFEITDISSLPNLRELVLRDHGFRRIVLDDDNPMPAEWANCLKAMPQLDVALIEVFDPESPEYAELLTVRPYLDLP